MSTLQSTSLKIIILFSGLHKLLHSNITRLSSLVGIEPLIFRDIDQIFDHLAKKSNGTRFFKHHTLFAKRSISICVQYKARYLEVL